MAEYKQPKRSAPGNLAPDADISSYYDVAMVFKLDEIEEGVYKQTEFNKECCYALVNAGMTVTLVNHGLFHEA